MLGELLQRVPKFEQTDLVIEGGVGGNSAMAYMVKGLFPNAFYVGIDLHPCMIPQNKARLIGSIDPRTYQAVLTANESVGSFPESALVCADCFDEHLVRDIMQRNARRYPLLVSIDALPFLLDNMTVDGGKLASDRHSIASILSKETPFIGQLHVSSSRLWPKDGHRPGKNEPYYYDLEKVAQGMDWWITVRFPNALILIRK